MLPILQDQECVRDTKYGAWKKSRRFTSCDYTYHHPESGATANIHVDFSHFPRISYISAQSAKGCAGFSISKKDKIYQLHNMIHLPKCHPAEFGNVLWGAVDTMHRFGIENVSAPVTEGGRIFAERTHSVYRPLSTEDEQIDNTHVGFITHYNLDGMHEYALQRLAVPLDYKRTSHAVWKT